MGNSLAREIPQDEFPRYTRHSSKCESIIFQGYRTTMEDAIVVSEKDVPSDSNRSNDTWIAVLDGHGGDSCVNYLEANLIDNLKKVNLQDIPETSIIQQFIYTEREYKKFINARVDSDEPETLRIRSPRKSSGACALVANIKDRLLTIAYVGDCGAILVAEDGTFTRLVQEHRPKKRNIESLTGESREVLDPEEERVLSAGLSIQSARVNGELAITRAFGDFEYKGHNESEYFHAVTCVPSVQQFLLRASDKYLLAFTDGLSDALSPEECIKILENESFKENQGQGLEELMKRAYEESKDNVAIVKYTF